MAKKINLIIKSCEECPYKQYRSDYEEYECKLLDKLLFFDDYNNKNEKNTCSKPMIYKYCPLDDE